MIDSDRSNEFEKQSALHEPGLVREFWEFLIHNKKWWLTPIVLVLLLMGLLILLSASPVAPFIYPVF